MASDQCVLVTLDDGHESGDWELCEVEVAANYWEGTTLADEDAGRRFVAWNYAQVVREVLTMAVKVRDAKDLLA
jgi:hypothetical protein